MYSGNSSILVDYNMGTIGFSEFGGNSSNTSHHDDFMDCPPTHMPMANIFFMILYALVCIIGLMGNTLVIYVVLRFSNMQTVTNMYILNLAIADECFLIGIPFLIATMNMGHWVFGGAMCKAYLVSTSITQFTSSIFLFIMSADRYVQSMQCTLYIVQCTQHLKLTPIKWTVECFDNKRCLLMFIDFTIPLQFNSLHWGSIHKPIRYL